MTVVKMRLDFAQQLLEAVRKETADDCVINPVLMPDVLRAAAVVERERVIFAIEAWQRVNPVDDITLEAFIAELREESGT